METINQQVIWANTFACVAKEGSFTRAAEILGCSKSYASRQVSQLENLLEVDLFYRTTRKLNLTEAGRVYLAHCQSWQQQVFAAQQAVVDLRTEVAGLLRITVPTSFGGVFMAQFLLDLQQRYPRLEVELDVSREPRDLEHDGYDLAVRSGYLGHERLVSKPLAVAELCLVASAERIAASSPLSSPADLQGWACLANYHFKDPCHWAFSRGKELHAVDIKADLRVCDYGLLRNLALAGAGAACLPHYLIAADLASRQLQLLLPDFSLPAQSLYLVYPQRLPQPAKQRALIDFFCAWFAQPERGALLGGGELKLL
ncbi:LysR family transcriptional regulator [Iodobacter fluviatilis]|uniref:LysR family transcriptional regulator n=1 Tax=Iodobacter fluviatilis TaxID=537 RepID=A0A7G3G7Y8_9NEIS|nr:LysR family transcriptional regulator [Iodobacter fluviatilis]QBC43427.1 LysR family transcriptional regulator [Iodobacter fluviatilis]